MLESRDTHGIASNRILITAGIALLGTIVGLVAWPGENPAPPQASRVEPDSTEPTEEEESEPLVESKPTARALPSPRLPSPKTAVSSAGPREEVVLMAKLRDLGPIADPELSLELAREGDEKFPASPDAAERGWFTVRALMEMRRTSDAIAKSRMMVEKYRGTSFADDVERHMLSHPMTHPSEVGYVEPD